MATAWFVLLVAMLAVYVVLDGFDLGVGALHRLLPRGDAEREQAAAAIGPVWNGNEVWLIASGGVLFLAFPRAYASAFSGMYLGLILALWLIVGRGLSLELRHQVDDPLWRTACDTVFWLASAGLALVLGVALGNVVRGVPLRPDGFFRLPLFDILNPYALLVGAVALVLLAAHGATFLGAYAAGPLAERGRRWAGPLWWGAAALVAVLAVPTYFERRHMIAVFGDDPWTLILPALTIGSLAAGFLWRRAGAWPRAFGASSVFLAGLLATAAAGLYPDVLPARAGAANALTVDNASAGGYALRAALVWWSIGMVLALTYFTVSYRLFLRRRRAIAGEA
jgi:cytochrome d ubiquinol oxidase subunit II